MRLLYTQVLYTFNYTHPHTHTHTHTHHTHTHTHTHTYTEPSTPSVSTVAGPVQETPSTDVSEASPPPAKKPRLLETTPTPVVSVMHPVSQLMQTYPGTEFSFTGELVGTAGTTVNRPILLKKKQRL